MKYSSLDGDGALFSDSEQVAVPDIYLHELLIHSLTSHGDQPIFTHVPTNNTLTASQVLENALTIASALHDHGVSEGETILISCPNNLLVDCSLMSSAGIGSACTAIPDDATLPEVIGKAEDSDAKYILCSESTLGKAKEAADACKNVSSIIVVDQEFDERMQTPSGKVIVSLLNLMMKTGKQEFPALKNSPQNLVAFMTYSSGSTGASKGFLKSHQNMVAVLSSCEPESCFIGSHETVFYTDAPPDHEADILLVLSAMFFGFHLVIEDGFEVRKFIKSIDKNKITHAFMTSPETQEIAKFDEVVGDDVSSLKCIVCLGSSLPIPSIHAVLRLFPGIRLVQDYGMTECGQACAIPFGFTNYRSVGRPHRGVRIKIVDRKTGKVRDANKTGETYIQTNQKILGYYKRPDENEKNFTPDGWIRSGDAAYFDEDGLIYIVGRYKDIIKCDSLQVSPAELENLILTHDSVTAASVVGVADEKMGEVAFAFLVAKETNDNPSEEVMDYVNQKLSYYKHIRYVKWVKELPMIGLGKVNRKLLRERAEQVATSMK